MSRQEDFSISRRMLFIMIFVSVAINIFFLLMGMLIGKQDSRRGGELNQTAEVEAEKTVDPLDEDLQYFPSQGQAEPPQVLDVPVAAESTEPPPSMDEQSEGVDLSEEPPEGAQQTREAQVQAEAAQSVPPVVEAKKPVAEAKKPEAAKQPEKPEAKGAAEQGSAFWLQVTAVGDKGKAEEVRKKLAANGFKAVLLNEGGLYKVQVGPYAARAEAETGMKQVEAKAGFKAFMKQR